MKYIEVTNWLESLDITFDSFYLRWGTDGEHNHTRASQAMERNKHLPGVGDWNYVGPFSTNKGRVSVVYDSRSIGTFNETLHSSNYRIYINRFHTDRSLHREQ